MVETRTRKDIKELRATLEVEKLVSTKIISFINKRVNIIQG